MRIIVNNFVHVIIGTIFLSVALWRIFAYHLTDHHHLGYPIFFFIYLTLKFYLKVYIKSIYFKLSCFTSVTCRAGYYVPLGLLKTCISNLGRVAGQVRSYSSSAPSERIKVRS
jgi:hypothetical protein